MFRGQRGGFEPVGEDELTVGEEEGGGGAEEERFRGDVREAFGDPDCVEGGRGEGGGDEVGVEVEVADLAWGEGLEGGRGAVVGGLGGRGDGGLRWWWALFGGDAPGDVDLFAGDGDAGDGGGAVFGEVARGAA